MNIPPSMATKLQEWNNGKGIDLEAWIGFSGTCLKTAMIFGDIRYLFGKKSMIRRRYESAICVSSEGYETSSLPLT